MNPPAQISLLLSLLLLHPISGAAIPSELTLRPNFTATALSFVDSNGAFLSSPSDLFRASIHNPARDSNYYLCVLHTASDRVVWSANCDTPISNSAAVEFTSTGIVVRAENGTRVWSAAIRSGTGSGFATLIRLRDDGNLVLLDGSNSSIWESFDYPTDTILLGQTVPVGTSLISSVSAAVLARGEFRMDVTTDDLALRWKNQTYWSMARDARATKDRDSDVGELMLNATGLYLVTGGLSSVAIWEVELKKASTLSLRIVTLEYSGRFVVLSYSGNSWAVDFSAPVDSCMLPLACGRLGICSNSVNSPYCLCPSGLEAVNPNDFSKGCNKGVDSVGFCSNQSGFGYLSIGTGGNYFANSFTEPVRLTNISACQDSCSRDCNCLGFFYKTGLCYVVGDNIGTVLKTGDGSIVGYVKVSAISSSNLSGTAQGTGFPRVLFILLPIGVSVLIITVSVLFVTWYRRFRIVPQPKAGSSDDSDLSDSELGESVRGLPVKFTFSAMEVATEVFKTRIGSGGFGTVYKGVLPDETLVAVKKIATTGLQGKREFYTEIATIGNIHHINLVRLHGFCAEGPHRLLVYEYMNRGSLDRPLFDRNSPAMSWLERVEIAIGTARGLAYLHSGCNPKIIHCDVKPENILLNDTKQVKLSDFGLSKLLTREESNLFTTMRGTRGYLAPEWLTSSAITEKADVYSYGMVLLEIISGRKNCPPSMFGQETASVADEFFPLYAMEMHAKRHYVALVDPRIARKVEHDEAARMVKVALCCVQEDPMLRPYMCNVVSMLEGLTPLTEPRLESLSFLRSYGRRFDQTSRVESGPRLSSINGRGSSQRISSSGSEIKTSTTSSISLAAAQHVSGPR